MRDPDYRGIAAAAIGVFGALGIFILVPMSIMFLGLNIGEAGSQILIALGGALVGAFATYMGMHVKDILPPQKTAQTENPNANAHRDRSEPLEHYPAEPETRQEIGHNRSDP